jgi:hypothetical protein
VAKLQAKNIGNQQEFKSFQGFLNFVPRVRFAPINSACLPTNPPRLAKILKPQTRIQKNQNIILRVKNFQDMDFRMPVPAKSKTQAPTLPVP